VEQEQVLLGDADVHEGLAVELVTNGDLVDELREVEEDAFGEEVVVAGVVEEARVHQGLALFAALLDVEVDVSECLGRWVVKSVKVIIFFKC
jgi:hypothetical protein